MASVTVTESIKAPLETVFDVLTDIPNAAETVEGITKIEMLSDGPLGVGTRWKETRVVFGKSSTEEMGITKFDRPVSFTVEADSCGCHYCTEFQIQSENGDSVVTMTLKSKPITLSAKLLSPLGFFMSGMMVKMLQKDLTDCKKACESR